MSTTDTTKPACEACSAGLPCVKHDPVVHELDDRPGVRVRTAPLPDKPFEALPRKPRRVPRAAERAIEVQSLRQMVENLARRLAAVETVALR